MSNEKNRPPPKERQNRQVPPRDLEKRDFGGLKDIVDTSGGKKK